MQINIPISPGELIDKLTILEIKLVEISDEKKLQNIRKEYDLLSAASEVKIFEDPDIRTLKAELSSTNKKIWESENRVREFWNDDKEFISAAKQSHFYNDERARIKKAINEHLGSVVIEEKSHPTYEHKA